MSLEIDDSGFMLACFDHAVSGIYSSIWDMCPSESQMGPCLSKFYPWSIP